MLVLWSSSIQSDLVANSWFFFQYLRCIVMPLTKLYRFTWWNSTPLVSSNMTPVVLHLSSSVFFPLCVIPLFRLLLLSLLSAPLFFLFPSFSVHLSTSLFLPLFSFTLLPSKPLLSLGRSCEQQCCVGVWGPSGAKENNQTPRRVGAFGFVPTLSGRFCVLWGAKHRHQSLKVVDRK